LAVLQGILNPVDQAPAFVIPVFRSRGGGNALLAQRIDSGDLIAAFDTVEGEGARWLTTEACEACVGSPALWAFQFDEDRVEVAQRARLAPQLLEALPDFASLPLLCVQILEFCRSPDVGPAYAAAHAKLEALAPGSGDLWRDLEVLSPQVRRALYRGLPRPSAESVRDLYDVIVLGEGGALEVRIPSMLLERLDGQRGAAALLRPLRLTLRALSLGKLEIVALDRSLPRPEAAASPTLHQHVLTVVSLGSKAAGAIAGATRRPGVRTLQPALVLGENDRLRPELGAVAGELFLLVLDETPEWLSYGAKLIEALSGRGCLVDVVIVRASLPEQEQHLRRTRQDLELRYQRMAQKARWVSVVGGGQSLGGNLKPLVAGAEPTRNSPTLLMKRLIQALATAPSAGAAGKEVMRVLHAKARGPKFAAVGTGAADGPEAAERAVRAAYASAERATPRPDGAREIALFVLHGPGAQADCVSVALGTARPLSGRAEVHAIGVPHRQLKSRVQVTLVARGFAQSGEDWLPPRHMTELSDAGWRWGHALPEVDVLEYYISREDAEFVLRRELDNKIDTPAAERIIDETPMYRGPVALLLSADPAPEVQATLRRAGIFTLVEGRVREFDEVAAEPYRFMLDALLAAPPQEALRSLRVIARDITMREFWQDEPYVRLNDPDDYVPDWLSASEPPEGVVEGLDLRRAKQERSLHVRGVLRLTPHPSKAGQPVAYQFWLVVDDAGLRLTRRMVRLTDEQPGGEQRQLPL